MSSAERQDPRARVRTYPEQRVCPWHCERLAPYSVPDPCVLASKVAMAARADQGERNRQIRSSESRPRADTRSTASCGSGLRASWRRCPQRTHIRKGGLSLGSARTPPLARSLDTVGSSRPPHAQDRGRRQQEQYRSGALHRSLPDVVAEVPLVERVLLAVEASRAEGSGRRPMVAAAIEGA